MASPHGRLSLLFPLVTALNAQCRMSAGGRAGAEGEGEIAVTWSTLAATGEHLTLRRGLGMILDILTVLFFVAGFVLLFRLIKQRRRDRGPYLAKTGRTANLTLHSIGPNEYAVIEDGNSVGRIMVAGDPHAEIWLWNCSLPGPGVSSGTAASLEDAQAELQQEWKKRKIGLQLKAKGK